PLSPHSTPQEASGFRHLENGPCHRAAARCFLATTSHAWCVLATEGAPPVDKRRWTQGSCSIEVNEPPPPPARHRGPWHTPCILAHPPACQPTRPRNVTRMFTVREIDNLDQLAPLRDQWESLVQLTPTASFFQSLDWLEAYWRHFGANHRLRV